MLKLDKFRGDILYIIDSRSLAKSIDAYCSFFGIPKKVFHDESKISSGTLSQWRNGTYEPDKKSLAKLVQYTNLTIEELLAGNFSAAVIKETSVSEKSDKETRNKCKYKHYRYFF